MSSHQEKILSEETLAEFAAGSQNDLMGALKELCHKHSTSPIILKGTEGIRDSFVVGKSFRRNARNAIFEMIVYKINDIKTLEENAERLNKDPATHERFLKHTGFKSDEEYQEYLRKHKRSYDGAPQFTLAQVLALNLKAKLRKNIRRAMGLDKGITGDHPRVILDDNTTILFRVIGRDLGNLGNHRSYYCELHKIREPVYYFVNEISSDEGMWISNK